MAAGGCVLSGGTASVNHPVVGELQLHRDKLPVGDDLTLVLYYPDIGSDSAEKLRLLASLATTIPNNESHEQRPERGNGEVSERQDWLGPPLALTRWDSLSPICVARPVG